MRSKTIAFAVILMSLFMLLQNKATAASQEYYVRLILDRKNATDSAWILSGKASGIFTCRFFRMIQAQASLSWMSPTAGRRSLSAATSRATLPKHPSPANCRISPSFPCVSMALTSAGLIPPVVISSSNGGACNVDLKSGSSGGEVTKRGKRLHLHHSGSWTG